MASGSENRSTANRLLLALAPEVFGRIGPHLERVEIERRQTIYRLGAAVEYLYFVDCGLISLVKTMRDGRTVEIGAIGIEGVSGSEALYGVNGAPLEAIVQIPGEAFRIRRDVLRREMDQNSVLRSLLMRYVHFAIGQLAQTAACNRLHSLEERCCRWLAAAGGC